MKKKKLKKRIEELEERVKRLEEAKDSVRYIDRVEKRNPDYASFPYIPPSPDNLKVTCCEAEKIEDLEETMEYIRTGIKS